MGHLWKGSKVIHRTGVKDDEVLRPPQMALDANEECSWRESNEEKYEN